MIIIFLGHPRILITFFATFISLPGEPRNPRGPVCPTGPVFPGDPVFPVSPGRPIGPTGPVAPVNPIGPSDPLGPLSPTRPCSPRQEQYKIRLTASLVQRKFRMLEKMANCASILRPRGGGQNNRATQQFLLILALLRTFGTFYARSSLWTSPTYRSRNSL